MRSLHNTVRRGVSAGEPLPDPYGIFARNKIFFRRGTVNMIAGPPGSRKTGMMLNIVKNMGPQVPTMYHSSDSDDFTMASRSLAMKMGISTEAAELKVMGQEEVAYEALRDFNHIRWSFKSGPTVADMEMEGEAYREMYGTYPHHTVLDIMMDLNEDGVAEQNYWTAMALLKDLARDQETCVTIVHHTSESAKGGSPPPRAAIMGKANQLPATILTLWGEGEEQMVSCVKNRFGPQDPMAKEWFTLKAQMDIMLITEPDNEGLVYREGLHVPASEKIDLLGGF